MTSRPDVAGTSLFSERSDLSRDDRSSTMARDISIEVLMLRVLEVVFLKSQQDADVDRCRGKSEN